MKEKANRKTDYQVGDKYQVTEEGSLGLLALGYQGLVAWRKAKADYGQQKNSIEEE